MRELSVIFERGEWRLIVDGITTGRPLLEREARLIAYALNSAFSSSPRADDARDGERDQETLDDIENLRRYLPPRSEWRSFTDGTLSDVHDFVDSLASRLTSAAPPEAE